MAGEPEADHWRARIVAVLAIGSLLVLVVGVSVRSGDERPAGSALRTHPTESTVPSHVPVPTAVIGGSSPPPTTSLSSGPPGPASAWHIAFNQSFGGSELDSTAWSTCFPSFTGTGCSNLGNNELEWYLPSQAVVSGGELHLVAQREPTAGLDKSGGSKVYPWRSGLVTTAKSFQFTYGYVQVRAKLPTAMGMWPALWLLPANGGWPPEIDIIETNPMRSGNELHMYVLHRTDGTRAQRDQVLPTTTPAAWNTYAILWTPQEITWYVNGIVKFHTTDGVPQQAMYLIANLAVAGFSGYTPDASTPDTDTMDIDQVEIWQQ